MAGRLATNAVLTVALAVYVLLSSTATNAAYSAELAESHTDLWTQQGISPWNELAYSDLDGMIASSEERPRIVKALPLLFGEEHEAFQKEHGSFVEMLARKRKRKHKKINFLSKKATPAVRRGGKPKPLPKTLENGNPVDLTKVHRECPPSKCPRKSSCPSPGGHCCRGGQVCCPTGTSCLTTNPPTCVHNSDNDMFRCAETKCRKGMHCPHKGVELCCLGGRVCCPAAFKCRATFPPTCVKLATKAEIEAQMRIERRAAQEKRRKKAQRRLKRQRIHLERMAKRKARHKKGFGKKKERHQKSIQRLRAKHGRKAAERKKKWIQENRTKKKEMRTKHGEKRQKARRFAQKMKKKAKRALERLKKRKIKQKRSERRRKTSKIRERKSKQRREQRVKGARKRRAQERKRKRMQIGTRRNYPGRSCRHIIRVSKRRRSGYYWIKPPKWRRTFRGYCDQKTDGGGWLLISTQVARNRNHYRARPSTSVVYHSTRRNQMFNYRILRALSQQSRSGTQIMVQESNGPDRARGLVMVFRLPRGRFLRFDGYRPRHAFPRRNSHFSWLTPTGYWTVRDNSYSSVNWWGLSVHGGAFRRLPSSRRCLKKRNFKQRRTGTNNGDYKMDHDPRYGGHTGTTRCTHRNPTMGVMHWLRVL